MYVDILQNFTKDKNMVNTTDVQAINNSINNLLFIKQGERVGIPQFGVGLERYLFEDVSDFLASIIEELIFDVLRFYETRIDQLSVKCTPDPDNNLYTIKISYTVLPGNITGDYMTVIKRI